MMFLLAVISIHALLAESDRYKKIQNARACVFLSTLSLRRATRNRQNINRGHAISIHALLAESDSLTTYLETSSIISIHALLAESDNGYPHTRQRGAISIHALLAESDLAGPSGPAFFLISIHALLAESDMDRWLAGLKGTLFLSTLSLRRATGS